MDKTLKERGVDASSSSFFAPAVTGEQHRKAVKYMEKKAWGSYSETLLAIKNPKAPPPPPLAEDYSPETKARKALNKAKQKMAQDFRGYHSIKYTLPDSFPEVKEELKKYRVVWCSKCFDYRPVVWKVNPDKTEKGIIPPQTAFELFCSKCGKDLQMTMEDIPY